MWTKIGSEWQTCPAVQPRQDPATHNYCQVSRTPKCPHSSLLTLLGFILHNSRQNHTETRCTVLAQLSSRVLSPAQKCLFSQYSRCFLWGSDTIWILINLQIRNLELYRQGSKQRIMPYILRIILAQWPKCYLYKYAFLKISSLFSSRWPWNCDTIDAKRQRRRKNNNNTQRDMIIWIWKTAMCNVFRG